jgi:hypothetical protein
MMLIERLRIELPSSVFTLRLIARIQGGDRQRHLFSEVCIGIGQVIISGEDRLTARDRSQADHANENDEMAHDQRISQQIA